MTSTLRWAKSAARLQDTSRLVRFRQLRTSRRRCFGGHAPGADIATMQQQIGLSVARRRAAPRPITACFAMMRATPDENSEVAISCALIAGGQPDVDAVLRPLLPDALAPLVVRDRDGTRVPQALELTRRVVDVGLHELFQFFLHYRSDPRAFGEVVHEDVVALLRVRPQIEDLRRGGDIFLSTLPAQVCVDCQPSGQGTVVTAQIEDKLPVVPPESAGAEFIFGKVE